MSEQLEQGLILLCGVWSGIGLLLALYLGLCIGEKALALYLGPCIGEKAK